jgi:hypothetical protein
MRLSMQAAALGLVSLSVLAFAGCTTYQDDLARGERAFEASEHERALAIFRSLENDTGRLTDPERAHYAYLRGMTDYRIGYKAEARHWLAIAAAIEQQTQNSLPSEWTKRMTASLKELNEEVFTAGIESLTNSADTKGKATPGDEEPASDSDSSGDAPKRDSKKKPAKSDDE